ncbi:MAG TPA: hypothetical protein VFQ35_05310 [Polyangiaceae bacterium]|nr:hypothetical protein [Polyangiaceae bacterium]
MQPRTRPGAGGFLIPALPAWSQVNRIYIVGAVLGSAAMRFPFPSLLVSSSVIGCSLALCLACDTNSNSNNNGQGGSPASGGSSSGGSSNAQGGATNSGGTASSSGGSSTSGGNSANGGSTSGGATSGGAANGGNSNGGSSNGGSSNGGSGMAAGGKTSGGAGGVGGGASGGGSNASGGNGGNGGASSGGCAKGADTIFCEDFETVPTGTVAKTNGYSPVTNNGTLTVDSTHARGMRALHVHTDGNGKAYIQLSPFAPPSNSFFGRMYIWVTAFPSAPDYAHFTLVEAAGTGAGVIRPIGGQYIPGKGQLWGAGSDSGPTGDWTNWKESAPAQAGKWLCMEWEMTAADNNINIWIDSTAKTDLSVSTKMHGGSSVDFVFPTFNNVWFGWWLYQSGPTPNQFDLWIDDISLGTKRQGC